MIDTVKKSLTTGISRVKWVAGFVAERTRAETTAAKLLYERSKIENKIDDLYRDIGRRVMELKSKEDKDVYKDFIVQQALDEVKNLKETADDYRKHATKVNKLPE
jgi:gas vesicle protein